MRIIAWRTLADYIETQDGHRNHKALAAALKAWHDRVRREAWRTSADIRQAYAHASIVGADRVVFNIVGNSYRLVTAVDYRKQAVFIKWIGTHDEYDHIDVRTVEFDG